jgi:hypothetical protein
MILATLGRLRTLAAGRRTNQEPLVAWVGRRQARTPAEQAIERVLRTSGPLPIDKLADQVTRQLIGDEMAAGAWLTETPLLGWPLYHRQAIDAIYDSFGDLIQTRYDRATVTHLELRSLLRQEAC